MCYFFLASGFMAMDSLRKRSFCSFWAHKFKRFFPFYVFVVCINMLLAKLGSLLYGVPFHHSLKDMLFQLLMGAQLYISNITVLDPVVWFLSILWLFYFYASLFMRRKDMKRNLLEFDLAVLISIVTIKVMHILEFGFLVELINYSFLLKALVFNLFIVIATILSLHSKHEISGTRALKWILLQYGVFIFVYSVNLDEILYVGRNEYIPWFTSYVMIFVIMYLCNSSLPVIKFLNFFDGISFPLYFCHGFMGFFLLGFFELIGFSRLASLLLAIPIVIGEAYLLKEYVLKKIAFL